MQKSTAHHLHYAGLLLILLLSACVPAWETTLVDAQGKTIIINRKSLQALESFAAEDGSVPLERLLYQHGYRLIETLEVTTAEGETLEYDWASSAEDSIAEDVVVTKEGRLVFDDVSMRARQIRAVAPRLPAEPTTSLLDIAPTVAAILDTRAPDAAVGKPLSLTSPTNADPVTPGEESPGEES
ncbi:MAG: hypothetical protein JW892_15125, partial [Anaerolineae bacterium]|nr:hypothetical protein [Anaerolineae bacterium]